MPAADPDAAVDNAAAADDPVDAFIERWKASGASERGNHQLFLSELCQEVLDMDAPAAPTGTGDGAPAEKIAWGGLSLAERAQAIQEIVSASPEPLTPEAVAARFSRARRQTVRDILDTLTLLGQTEETESGAFAG